MRLISAFFRSIGCFGFTAVGWMDAWDASPIPNGLRFPDSTRIGPIVWPIHLSAIASLVVRMKNPSEFQHGEFSTQRHS